MNTGWKPMLHCSSERRAITRGQAGTSSRVNDSRIRWDRLVVRFGSGDSATGESIVTLTTEQDEGVVVAVHCPWSGRDFSELGKSPVTGIFVAETEIIPDGWRNVQTGTLIQIGSRAFVAKDILPVIGAERATIFPLSITNSVPVTNGKPTTFQDGLTIPDIRLLKPRDDLAGFRFGSTAFDVVVGKRDIKRILPGNEVDRNKISSGSGIRAIIASIAIVPIPIPGTTIVRDRVIAARAFTDPEDGGNNSKFPGVAAGTSTQRGFPSH